MRFLIPAVLSFFAVSAHAQERPSVQITAQCDPYEITKSGLASKYGETRAGAGMMDGYIIELWLSPDGSFSVLLTTPQGLSCLIGSGNEWQAVPPGVKS